MKILFGLGNPGRSYRDTRHNVGFRVIDRLAGSWDVKLKKSWRFPVLQGEASVAGERVLLVKPQTFMNRSGDAVARLSRKKGVASDGCFVIYDDVDLECGRIRVRAKGSAGGNNGLKSIIQMLGTQDFPRIRVGIGPRPSGEQMVDFVLGTFTNKEKELAEQGIEKACSAVRSILENGLEQTMTEYNG